MALTRLDNLYSSKTGKYLYVSPDDFNATDSLDNRGNSPLRPFKTIQRAFIEVARFSYLPGKDDDRFDQFSIMLMPGDHYIDNRPGIVDINDASRQRYFDSRNLINANRTEIVDRAFAQIIIDYDEAAWGVDWVVPGDEVVGPSPDVLRRGQGAYRLIQKNRTEIIDAAIAAIAAAHPTFVYPGGSDEKCRRDTGFFIDALSLDVSLGGANVYTRKFLQNYFNGNTWVDNGLQGEEAESITGFEAARDYMKLALTNQLTVKDLTLTPDPSTGSNTNTASCSGIQQNIENLTTLVTTYITQGNIDDLETVAPETRPDVGPGESKCKRDIGYIVDAVASDLGNGGNASIIAATKAYFEGGLPIINGLVGEEAQSVIAFAQAGEMMKKAVTNQLYSKDLTISPGPAYYGVGTNLEPVLPSGNGAACIDVQNSIDTLVAIINTSISNGNLDELDDLEVSGDIPVFYYDQAKQEWNDQSVLDLSNPDNVLYKFNATTGGAIVPRGCSLVGYDLRRTIVRPLYVPDPADGTQERTTLFNLTGGCYLWQFTIKDGDLTSNSPLYDDVAKVGKVYFQKGNNSQLAIPEYSHHKICIMEYAENAELDAYYLKVGKAFSLFQPTIDDGNLETLPQENRIVGPLSDTRNITKLKLLEQYQANGKDYVTIEATTKIPHGYFIGQYIAVVDNGLNDVLNGTFKVTYIDLEDPRIFRYDVETTLQLLAPLEVNAEGYTPSTTPELDLNCRAQAEIDSVESASPYVFNCSIRSTWGQCGMWANGAKSTGFRSMVVAQYTGVSLQKDDRAFIRYDEFSNTWNQASLTDAFATTAYHTKGDAYWKDDWRNFHIRASDDSFIQCVSVFAVGFFDHFLMESGGDMSITNSNSNFGNTSLHSIGYKGFAFNQDKGGYITDIVPVKEVETDAFNIRTLKYFPLSNQASKVDGNLTKLYYSGDDVYSPFTKPATSIEGYRIGAKTDEKIYLKLPKEGGGNAIFEETLSPTGFKRYTAAIETLNPDGVNINNNAQDAANLIEANKAFIQREAYNYIITRYPELQTKQSITIEKCERDIGYIVDAVIQDLRVGGNINMIKAAEGYYVGGTLSYIDGEYNESIEAYEYVRNLCIAAMRNFDILIKNPQASITSTIVNVGDTSGIVVGMLVRHLDYTTEENGDSPFNFSNGRLNRDIQTFTTSTNPVITGNVYVRRIIDSERIELGDSQPTLSVDADGILQADFGNGVFPTNPTNTGAYFHFEFPQTADATDDPDILVGAFTDIAPVRDSDVLQDTTAWNPGSDPETYPECAGIATQITQNYFDQFFLILNNGLTPLGGTEVDAHNLLIANKDYIAEEAYYQMLTDSDVDVNFVPGLGADNWKAKIVAAVEAMAYNIKYGTVDGDASTNRVYDHLLPYVQNPGVLNGERLELVTLYNYAAEIASDYVIKNQPYVTEGSHGLTQYIDLRILGDTSGLPGVYDFSADCNDIKLTIQTFNSYITQSIGTDAAPGSIFTPVAIPNIEPEFTVATRIEPTVDTVNLAARATLFSIDTGGGTSNPHYFETGTPVRLVPRIRDGVDPNTVDKRVIRLPKGFDTNTIYYVIAPGRTTQPENYADGVTYPNTFTSQQTTKLMLATTKENAAAGIYMYSSETESVDYNVQIDFYNYVLDESYRLHQYQGNFVSGQSTTIQTDAPHIFDVPGTAAHVQPIFFRTFGTNSTLPEIPGGQTVDPNRYYYARFETDKKISVYDTAADAVAGATPITFNIGTSESPIGQNFYIFANKRESPVKFDPTRDDSALLPDNQETTTGQWYIQTTDDFDPTKNIIARMNTIGDDLKDARSKNTTYERLEDDRGALDRIYRLRYVIPKFADGVRDPLNGFVLKARTDTTRKLVPQRIVLKRVDTNSPQRAIFTINVPGVATPQVLGAPNTELDVNFEYNPYKSDSVKIVGSERTDSKVAFSIQSARTIESGSNTGLLELTVFDHTITDDAVRNEQFITVKIDAPQGGSFRFNTSENNELNKIIWNGFASGSGYVQGYFNPEGTDEHYLILKELEENNEERETVEYNPVVATTLFQPVLDADNDPVFDAQGNALNIYAKLLAKQDSIGSPNLSLAKSLKEDYLYSDKETNVFTMTPGDVIRDDDNKEYEIISVEDIGEIEDTFYIFDVEEIKRRIPNQQEGIYYLTCVKGNVSPYPTGAGVGTNFRNFKFSQPISQLYPINYKNDPLWFKQLDLEYTDPPATVCAADNFIHGLVTTNDYKNSTTKEVVLDFLENPALSRYEYTNTTSSVSGATLDNRIRAQAGNATSGSEDRKIPIAGDSVYPTEQRLYVELRRPSIARSGNHTFEYLGFGPGNYSTGFPLRQEVVLEDIQDFYAQAKREDGGIVFYTGLNSNGDLYIGNKKINAITGEETFLEKAELLESEDEDDDVGGLVTTFELPVVFEQEITVDGDALFNNPVTINVDSDEGNALTIEANVDSASESGINDITLDSATFNRSTILSGGNIVLTQNNIFSAIYRFNPRGNSLLQGQNYSFRTSVDNTNSDIPSNRTPNQSNSALGFEVKYGTQEPISGDVLLKGEKVGRKGSFGWIYANDYTDKNSTIVSVRAMGGNIVRFTMDTGKSTTDEGLVPGAIVRLSGFGGDFININGIREVLDQVDENGDSLNITSSFIIAAPLVIDAPDQEFAVPAAVSAVDDTATVELSDEEWREWGILGAEAIRTDTDNRGRYRVGINTLSRSAHADHNQAFVSEATNPNATLDVMGNTWVSGYLMNENDYTNNAALADRSFQPMANAFIVGLLNNNFATASTEDVTFRVSTTNGYEGAHENQTAGAARDFPGGRVGINVSEGLMNHTLTVVGDARITEDVLLEENLQVDGGSISTKQSNFSLFSANVTDIDYSANATQINLANLLSSTDGDGNPTSQDFNFSNNVANQNLAIGTFSTTGELRIHTNPNATSYKVRMATNGAPLSNDNINVIRMGGAFSTQSNNIDTGSLFKIYNRFTEIDGELKIAANDNNSVAKLYTGAATAEVFALGTKTVDFALGASRVNIGAEGGFTTVNNSLAVQSSTTMYGDATLSGGLNSGKFEVRRGSFSTDTPAHAIGDIDFANIDLFSRVEINKYIATKGSEYWGDSSYQVDATNDEEYFLPFTTPTNSAIFSEGAYLLVDRSRLAIFDPTGFTGTFDAGQPTIVASDVTWMNTVNIDLNFVRIESPGIEFADGTTYAKVISLAGNTITLEKNFAGNANDATAIAFSGGETTQDTNTSPVGQQYSELLEIVELTNLNTLGDNPLQIKVKRARNQLDSDGNMIPDGSGGYKFLRDDHPKNSVIVRYNLAEDVSFIDSAALPAISPSTATPDVLVDTGDFSGSVGQGDILRFTDTELAEITDVNATSPQRFVVHDGNDANPTEQFVVDSTTGNVTILGETTINKTFTFNGSTALGAEMFTINNGAGTTTFEIDSSNGTVCFSGDLKAGGSSCDRLTVIGTTGDTTIRGGDLNITTDDVNNNRLQFQNTEGNLTLHGVLQIQGPNENVFEGQLTVNGGNFKVGELNSNAPKWEPNTTYTFNEQVYYGPYLYRANKDGTSGINAPVHTSGTIFDGVDGDGNATFGFTFDGNREVTDRFEITSSGAMNFAGFDSFFTNTGARKWDFIPDGFPTFEAVANVNYFITPSTDFTLLLPDTANDGSPLRTGDMIRIVDVGGNLTYNKSLRCRAKNGVLVQGDITNGNIPDLASLGYNGGELVVQTPHASFGLVYLGGLDGDGNPNNASPSVQGWWLMEI